MSLTIEELKDLYYPRPDIGLVEVTDRESALSDLASKTSACWGSGPIGSTGWIQLATPSKQHRGDMQTVFVCKEELIK